MKFEVKSKSSNEVKFRVSGIDASLANSLRRTILTEVPVLAIDEVVFFDNDSPTSDEILAHSLAMVPIRTVPGKYGLPEECADGKTSKPCRAVLTLDAKAGDSPIQVYSGALLSDDPEVYPVSLRIPLTYIPSNGKIRLEAYAVMGRGKDHAKWQPVSTISYKFQPIIAIDTSRCKKDCVECVKACPRGVLRSDGGMIVIDPDECSLCESCKEACPDKPPAIEVGYKEDTFLFRLEPTGALPAKEILLQALQILKEKSTQLQRTVEELEAHKESE